MYLTVDWNGYRVDNSNNLYMPSRSHLYIFTQKPAFVPLPDTAKAYHSCDFQNYHPHVVIFRVSVL